MRVQSKKVTQRRTLADQDTSGHKGLWGWDLEFVPTH